MRECERCVVRVRVGELCCCCVVVCCLFVFFFFFKQKTAYEISACLVGSEMCIRGRGWVGWEKVRDGDGDGDWRWEVGDGRW